MAADRTYICFLDWKAAFDMVNRDHLLLDCIEAGVGPVELTLIAKLLRTTSAAGTRTYRGVHQGGVISPSLFNLYSN